MSRHALQLGATAIPPGLIPDGEPLFTGTNTTLTFFTVEPGREAPLKVTLRLDGTSLIAETDTQSLTLSEDTHGVSIHYYGQINRDDSARWTDLWEVQGLPRLVKVEWWDVNVGLVQVPVVTELGAEHHRGARNLENLNQ